MAVATHLETERKYETGVDTELPALQDIPGVAQVDGPRTEQLEAIYFDTADLRLARHGATLRRRTGGTDAGWHLKVPAGPDSRSELRLPLTASATNAPPDELADLTFGMTRGAEIRPVARISTTREVWQLFGRNGKPLAEVTDDHVDARRLGDSSTVDTWRELEVELADQDSADVLDRAEKVLRTAGIRRAKHSSKLARVLPAPSDTGADTGAGTAGDAVLSYVRAQFEAIVAWDLRVRQDAEDAVHQMRVATRRLRSVLRVYDRIVDGARTRGLRAELQWLGRRLAEARDLEVQHEHVRAVLASLPAELVVGPVEARLTRHFGPAEAAARRTVVKTLGDKRYRRLLDDIDRLLTDPPLTSRAARPARKELPKHLRRAYRKVAARVRPETLHRGRKAAKRYRYGLEVAEPAVGKKARRARKRAKALTKVLGEHQDGMVAQPVLRELGMRAHLAGENGFTFGLLVAREQERCARVEREYPAYWKRVRKSRM
jgi:CHAD domain-containing protein/uncharacterized protein YjbK